MPITLSTSLSKEYDPKLEERIILECLDQLTRNGYGEVAQRLRFQRQNGVLGIDAEIERKYKELVASKDPLYHALYHSVPNDVPTDAPGIYREQVAAAAILFDQIMFWGAMNGNTIVPNTIQAIEAKKRDRDIGNIIDQLKYAVIALFSRDPALWKSLNEEERASKGSTQHALQTFIFRDLGSDPGVIPSKLKEIIEVREKLSRKMGKNFTQEAKGADFIYGNILDELGDLKLSEDQIAWLKEKIEIALRILPMTVIRSGGFAQLIRTMIGVALVTVSCSPMQQNDKDDTEVFLGIKGGYYLGLAYAVMDNVIDNNSGLPQNHQEVALRCVEKFLQGGDIDPQDFPKDFPHAQDVCGIFKEMRQDYPFEEYHHLYSSLLVLHVAQLYDQRREDQETSANHDFYPDIILKSAFSRIAMHLLAGANVTPEMMRFFYITGLRNQLCDDFADFPDDLKHGVRTPYTHYYKHQDQPGITNPFHLMMTIGEMLMDEYKYEEVGDIIHTRFLILVQDVAQKYGMPQLEEMLAIFCPDPQLKTLLLTIASGNYRITHVDTKMQQATTRRAIERKAELMTLKEFMSAHIKMVERVILVSKSGVEKQAVKQLVDAMNYSLEAGGKRMRPILALIVADMYGMDVEKITPLIAAIESLHTSSLIFDDLPAQDGADLRRGKPTLHVQSGEAVAQLAGISLLIRAFEELADLPFSPDKVIQVIKECTMAIGYRGLCAGQLLDLQTTAAQGSITIDLLVEMSYLKTSLAFEASIVPIIILAGKPEDKTAMQEFCRHLGIAFQIKDDLLDVEGTTAELGKKVGIDGTNNSATFVSLCGVETTKKLLAEHLQKARQALTKIQSNTRLLGQVVDYIEQRNK